jgi:glycosyltransferase involved in cell wall biosynthesis
VRRLAQSKGVVVTGFVDDVRDYVALADVCVVPLRIARGVQNKLLEAMAMGRSLVVTSHAAEGIVGTDGGEFIVADQPQAFAEAVLTLLHDRGRRGSLGESARRCVERNYSWEGNLSILTSLGL